MAYPELLRALAALCGIALILILSAQIKLWARRGGKGRGPYI